MRTTGESGTGSYNGYGRQYNFGLPTEYTFTGQESDGSGLIYQPVTGPGGPGTGAAGGVEGASASEMLVPPAQTLMWGTGLVYMHARYYDPYTGQFLSPDTIVPDPNTLNDYNRYMYVRGNPLKFSDPSGHYCMSWINLGTTCATGNEEWDTFQLTLDAAGVVEPTPFADGTNTVVSLLRGNWTDAGLSALGIIPYLGDLAKGAKYGDEIWAVGKGVWNFGKNALGLSDEAIAAYRSFSVGNFRYNVGMLRGAPEVPSHAHHILPQEFRRNFTDAGLNIHEPQFGVWVEATKHLKEAHAYNERWRVFFRDNPTPTAEQILGFANDLMKEYGYVSP